MLTRYICIHGHFYQPPRENAWLETIEQQDSAAPFHDWNERINFECYATNASARILDEQARIRSIVNNYERISYNFGPTLLSWLAEKDTITYSKIIHADQVSRDLNGGHGNALAQVHSHVILPLANRRDKETQVTWGIRDFEHRYGRKPEGMWLAETAADTETLEVLAEQGIAFTVLAPRQAKAVRHLGEERWRELGHAEVDPREPYLCKLPSGRTIVLFFYDGMVSQDVAFKGLLNDGSRFANRLMDAFDKGSDRPQLVHIATDGESYGHHHRHGEMALAAALEHIAERDDVQLINYAYYLELHPPQREARIHENSSWSCVHGVERWRSNCGCNTGGPNAGTQAWRGPLRDALDLLRDRFAPFYEEQVAAIVHDPWAARNDYINVLLNRCETTIQSFVERNCKRELSQAERTRLLRLMELQRNAVLMYTSCGWFFDEISGLETNQILQYALRAIYYARRLGYEMLLPEFEQRLEGAPSNVFANGAESFRRYVIPTRLNLLRAAMHFATASLFVEEVDDLRLFMYEAKSEVFDKIEAGQQRLVVGRVILESQLTQSQQLFSFAVLYLGQQNIIGNITPNMSHDRYEEMSGEVTKAFNGANLGKVIGLMQSYFDEEKFSIWHLFRDEKRRILKDITAHSMEEVEQAFTRIYNDNYQLMSGMQLSEIPVPRPYLDAVRYVLNNRAHHYFEHEPLDLDTLQSLQAEFRKWDVTISNVDELKLTIGNRLLRELTDIAEAPSTDRIRPVNEVLHTLKHLHLEPDLWQSQNVYYSLLQRYHNGLADIFESADWRVDFEKLGRHLGVAV